METGASEDSRSTLTGLKDVQSWSPPASTNSATSAYVDTNNDSVYQASRSERPAQLFTNLLSDGSAVSSSVIKNTTGSWDMTTNGSLLAVGTNGDGTTRPRVIVRNTTNNKVLADSQLPTSTSASAYVMSLAPDQSNPKAFWVGTYDPQGARLYRFNSSNGKFEDFTPGNAWRSAGLKYVRSLSSTAEALAIGLGNPGAIWLLKDGAKTPYKANNALGSSGTSMVYSMASTTSAPKADPLLQSEPEEQLPSESVEEPQSESVEQPQSEPAEQPQSANPPQAIEVPRSADESPSFDTSPERQIGTNTTGQAPQLFVAGTEAPATVNVFGADGTKTFSFAFQPDEGKTIDRIAIDEERVAWFTLRPSGNLYRLELDSNTGPEFISQTVHGSETRAISAKDGVISGVTGTRQLWRYNVSSNSLEVNDLGRNVPENPDVATQGIISTPNATLVGAHWRYQSRDLSGKSSQISLPGEPKAQILVKDQVYSAIYPSASLVRVDPTKQESEVVAVAGNDQFRPRALVQNARTNSIYMATSSAYGTYGGGITSYDLSSGKSKFYPTPVKDQAPFSMDAIGNGLVIGMSTAGEAVGSPANAKTAIVRWENGTVVWKRTLDTNQSVTGIATISDGRGDFVFATTYNSGAYALDASTGTILWQASLAGAGNAITSVNNYVLVTSGANLTEYFPTRTALTKGKVLAKNTKWANLQEHKNGTLEVSTVTSSSVSAIRGKIATPREVRRVQGNDRYATAIAVSQQEFSSSKDAIIATGNDFPDALCAGPLAAQLKAPILLNTRKALRSDVEKELSRLGVKKVYIAGGNGVISDSVKNALTRKGIAVERLGGKDRFDTSIKIANRIQGMSGKASIPIIATTGMLFPDALSATPAAASTHGAIILTNQEKLNSQTKKYLKSGSVTSVATVGGLSEKAVKSAGIKSIWAANGRDRYETSAKVAARIANTSKIVYVATGNDFPDGLAGSPVAARDGAPVILTTTKKLSNQATASIRKATQVTSLGGIGVISTRVLDEIRSL